MWSPWGTEMGLDAEGLTDMANVSIQDGGPWGAETAAEALHTLSVLGVWPGRLQLIDAILVELHDAYVQITIL